MTCTGLIEASLRGTVKALYMGKFWCVELTTENCAVSVRPIISTQGQKANRDTKGNRLYFNLVSSMILPPSEGHPRPWKAYSHAISGPLPDALRWFTCRRELIADIEVLRCDRGAAAT